MEWIFGYGSLVWRPEFAYRERRPGYIRGYARRFWQSSPDHRGTPELPGRVVTLIERPDALCWGTAYGVPDADWRHIAAQLDIRERKGYRRVDAQVHLAGAYGSDRADDPDAPQGAPDAPPIRALMYIATVENPHFLGPAPMTEIAARVRLAHGPSGSNREYVSRLASALADMGVDDEHVSELARLL